MFNPLHFNLLIMKLKLNLHTQKVFATAMLLATPLLLTACKDDEPAIQTSLSSYGIGGLYVSPDYNVNLSTPFTIKGEGLLQSDVITLVSQDGELYKTTTAGVTENSLSATIDAQTENGTYALRLDRENGQSFMIGKSNFKWIADINVPDKAGMTVKGAVTCKGKPLPGVAVSDGVEIVLTDENGFYWLPSAKELGTVFITLPEGYFTSDKTGMPAIWQPLNQDASTVEQHDFSLKKMEGDYTVIALTDFHLANRGSSSNNDMNQFQNNFVPDLNATIARYKAEGKNVVGVGLGDITWDTFWYEKNYRLPDALADMDKINMPVFHCMGNHDNDIRAISDIDASKPWRQTVGPNYYSFNLGKVHYVALDDIVYTTDGAENKTETPAIDAVQMQWLKKDLDLISDKSTPVVLCMHIPLHGHPGRSETGELLPKMQLQNSEELVALLQPFSKVRILSGHTHVNYNIPVGNNIIEHNVAGACATWWWTGKYYNTHICRDGSIGGYCVFEWTGKDYNRYYKSIGYDKDYQFRTYDRNNLWLKFEDWAPAQNASDPVALANFSYLAQDYAFQHTNNEVIINVFSWEDSWKMEVTENGNILPWTVTNWFDPLHIINFDMWRLNKNNENLQGSAMKTSGTSHLFRVHASSPESTLEIKVTDCYGNVYRQTMTRPKTFGITME